MINIGLTGNACSGYDKVSEIFQTLYEVPVFDADVALKFLLNYRIDIIRDIRITFGSEIYDGPLINPRKFDKTEKFDRLVEIAQNEIMKLFDTWKRKQDAKNKYVIFKSAILFEREFDEKMDCNISVFKSKNDRAMELARGTNCKLSDAYDIVSAEMDELVKNQASKWVIHNNFDDLSLLAQTENIHGLILNKAVSSRRLLPMRTNTTDTNQSVINITA